MFTTNYKNWKKDQFLGNLTSRKYVFFDGSSQSVPQVIHINAPDIGYLIKKAYCVPLASVVDSYPDKDTASPGIYFGSGITPATESDYTLEVPITAGLTITTINTATTQTKKNQYAYTSTFVLENTVSVPISISEVGIFGQLIYSGSVGYTPILFERTVLDTPVVIQPGESRAFEYRIFINHVLAEV